MPRDLMVQVMQVDEHVPHAPGAKHAEGALDRGHAPHGQHGLRQVARDRPYGGQEYHEKQGWTCVER
mgnify:CR=1 FL=1